MFLIFEDEKDALEKAHNKVHTSMLLNWIEGWQSVVAVFKRHQTSCVFSAVDLMQSKIRY